MLQSKYLDMIFGVICNDFYFSWQWKKKIRDCRLFMTLFDSFRLLITGNFLERVMLILVAQRMHRVVVCTLSFVAIDWSTDVVESRENHFDDDCEPVLCRSLMKLSLCIEIVIFLVRKQNCFVPYEASLSHCFTQREDQHALQEFGDCLGTKSISVMVFAFLIAFPAVFHHLCLFTI